jgi:hypothetical protein
MTRIRSCAHQQSRRRLILELANFQVSKALKLSCSVIAVDWELIVFIL